MTYGYIRVSSKEQHIDRQMIAFLQFPVAPENIFIDRLSGKNFNRAEYKRLMKKLQQDDILVIDSIDRLGRNYEEILEQWRVIVKVKKVFIVVLDMPLLDTRQTPDNLLGSFIADLVLQIMSYVAQKEWENIKRRQREGIDAAKLRGVHFGRPKKQIPEAFHELYEKWRSGEIGARDAAAQLHVSPTTFLNWVREQKNREAA